MSIDKLLGKPIQDLIDGFDWKPKVNESSSDTAFVCKLAPSFGELTSETCKHMDNELLIMIAGAVRLLEKMPPGDRTWDAALAVMMQCPMLEISGNEHEKIDRCKTLPKEGSNWFKFDSTPDQAIVEEVKSWVKSLIEDPDVIETTNMDRVEILANIVATISATIDSFGAFFAKDEFRTRDLVDIGILRFPDATNPYIKVYHLKLTAWSKCSHVILKDTYSNGISGEFNSRIFRPRKEIMAGLAPEVTVIARKEVNALFGV